MLPINITKIFFMNAFEKNLLGLRNILWGPLKFEVLSAKLQLFYLSAVPKTKTEQPKFINHIKGETTWALVVIINV